MNRDRKPRISKSDPISPIWLRSIVLPFVSLRSQWSVCVQSANHFSLEKVGKPYLLLCTEYWVLLLIDQVPVPDENMVGARQHGWCETTWLVHAGTVPITFKSLPQHWTRWLTHTILILTVILIFSTRRRGLLIIWTRLALVYTGRFGWG